MLNSTIACKIDQNQFKIDRIPMETQLFLVKIDKINETSHQAL